MTLEEADRQAAEVYAQALERARREERWADATLLAADFAEVAGRLMVAGEQGTREGRG